MIFFLPESYSPTVLYRRAQRLRKRTGNTNLASQSEIDQKNLTPGKIVREALLKRELLPTLGPGTG
jgi:MFS transporter, DHA1 family, multidrug resistance protein